MVTLCSWTATIVFMVMFPKLVKDKTRKQFIKELFTERLSFKLIALIMIVQLAIFGICVGVVSIYHNVTIRHFLNGSLASIVSGFFVQLIGGPLGEEPAYRGFSLPYMQKEHGVSLLVYCVTFLTSIVACSVVMSVIYRYRKNLIYAILIHQMVNFSLDILFTGDLLEIFVPFAVLYVAVAIVIGIGYVKR